MEYEYAEVQMIHLNTELLRRGHDGWTVHTIAFEMNFAHVLFERGRG